MRLWSRVALVWICCLAISPSAAIVRQINDRLSVDFSERFRFVSWDNAISLDNSAKAALTFTRHRTSVLTKWQAGRQLELGVKLTNEFRYHFLPEGSDFNLDEVFIDNLYAAYTIPSSRPITLTVGRQNIRLDEGFIVMDGHPLDGSRSIYFNAVRADWRLSEFSRLTAFYSYQEEKDTWLPRINNRYQALVEQPEEGIGLHYHVGTGPEGWSAYLVRKSTKANEAVPYASSINAIGGRFAIPRGPFPLATAEVAYQFGQRGDVNRSAVGGHGYLTRSSADTTRWFIPRSITVGAIYLSGDDPSTTDYEGWDPMFARWPKWSEAYVYTQIKEDGVAWWTNLMSLYLESTFELSKAVDLRLTYHHLVAPQASDTTFGFPGGGGETRGSLYIGKLSYRFDSHWSGQVLWESFFPGDFYFDGADRYTWLRTELMYTY